MNKTVSPIFAVRDVGLKENPSTPTVTVCVAAGAADVGDCASTELTQANEARNNNSIIFATEFPVDMAIAKKSRISTHMNPQAMVTELRRKGKKAREREREKGGPDKGSLRRVAGHHEPGWNAKEGQK